MRAIATTLAAAALLLSGCGGDDGTATDTTSTTGEQTTATTAPAADAVKELEECLRDAGAKLASSPADLRFAAGSALRGDVRTDISAERGNLRLYSLRPSGENGWRIYAAAPRGAGAAPGLADLVRDPGAAVVTAYVDPADPGTNRAADACMTG
jgi:hypothetical protein